MTLLSQKILNKNKIETILTSTGRPHEIIMELNIFYIFNPLILYKTNILRFKNNENLVL